MISIGIRRGVRRPVLTLVGDQLSPRVLATDELGARIALVATCGLLLAGDDVNLSIDVGAGCWLEIVDVAGTVAYNGRGVAARWTTHLSVAQSAVLCWNAEPFVVAEGAVVTRRTEVELAASAVACLRETLVLGRSGEVGGMLDARTTATLDGQPLLVERLDLCPSVRRQPGVLGPTTVIDTALLLGCRAPTISDARVFRLAAPGVLARSLGTEVHRSPVQQAFADWRSAALDGFRKTNEAADRPGNQPVRAAP